MHEKYQDFDSMPFQLLQGLTIAFDPLNASNKEDSGDLLQVQPEKGVQIPPSTFLTSDLQRHPAGRHET